MELGCCASFAEYDLVAAAGFDFIELKGIEVCGMSEAAFAEAAEKIAAGPLTCPVLNGYCNAQVPLLGPGYERERVRRYAQKIAGRARALGASQVGVGAPFARTIPDGYPRKQAEAEFCEALEITAGETSACGVEVLLEPLSVPMCNYINTTREAYEIVRRLDRSNLVLMADFFHADRMGEELTELTSLLRAARHVHISGFADGVRTYLQAADEDKYRSWARALKEAGYGGRLSLEIAHPHTAEGLSGCRRDMERLFAAALQAGAADARQ